MKNVIFNNGATDLCKPSVSYIGLKLGGETNGRVLLNRGNEWLDADAVAIEFNANGEHGVILRVERTTAGDFIIEKTREV